MSSRLGQLSSFVASEVVRQTAWNGVGQFLPVLVGAALTPLLVQRLGVETFGVWALALAVLGVLTAVDGGIGASLVRFFGGYRAEGDTGSSTSLFVAATAFVVALGCVTTTLTFAAAPWFVRMAQIPPGLIADATFALRWTGPLVTLALLGSIPLALLQANGRFRVISAVTSVSAVLFGVAAVLLVDRDGSVRSLVVGLVIRLGAVVVLATLASARHLSRNGSLRPSLSSLRRIARYSLAIQVSGLLGLVNSQMDAIIIAAFLPVRFVGLYAIGFQAAWTVRGIALLAMQPVATSLYVAFGRGGRDAAAGTFRRLNLAWQQTVTPFAVVSAAAVAFAVPAWIGRSVTTAGWVAAGLTAGYAANITTGVASSYLRAVGRPEVETRYSALAVVVNVLLTVPLAITWGVYGVVAGTVVGTVVGTGALPYLGRAAGLPELRSMLDDLPVRRLVAAGVATLALEVALTMFFSLSGPLQLVSIAIPPTLVFAGFVGRRSRALFDELSNA